MGHTANMLVKLLTSTDKAKKIQHHNVIIEACRLFSIYYIEAAKLAGNLQVLTSTKEFGHANSLLHEVKKWLNMYLPAKLSSTGKELTMPDEFQVCEKKISFSYCINESYIVSR